MAYRNKTYVAFDGDNDIHYYRLMMAWKQNDNTDFVFCDAHEIRQNIRDTSSEDTIKQALLERMRNSKVFVLLVGEHTKNLHCFVRWEIDHAINIYKLPIIVVNLNGFRECDKNLCPPIARDTLAIHISFNSRILQYALENWPESHYMYVKNGDRRDYKYKDVVYKELGL